MNFIRTVYYKKISRPYGEDHVSWFALRIGILQTAGESRAFLIDEAIEAAPDVHFKDKEDMKQAAEIRAVCANEGGDTGRFNDHRRKVDIGARLA